MVVVEQGGVLIRGAAAVAGEMHAISDYLSHEDDDIIKHYSH